MSTTDPMLLAWYAEGKINDMPPTALGVHRSVCVECGALLCDADDSIPACDFDDLQTHEHHAAYFYSATGAYRAREFPRIAARCTT